MSNVALEIFGNGSETYLSEPRVESGGDALSARPRGPSVWRIAAGLGAIAGGGTLCAVALSGSGVMPDNATYWRQLTESCNQVRDGGVALHGKPYFNGEALHDCFGAVLLITCLYGSQIGALLAYSVLKASSLLAAGAAYAVIVPVGAAAQFALHWYYYSVFLAGITVAAVLVWWLRRQWLEKSLGGVEVPKPAEPIFKIGILSKTKEGLLCTTQEGVRIVIDEASFAALAEVKRSETTNEALVAGHPFYPAALPKSVVRFVSESGQTLGLGVRIGNWLVTAMHVIALVGVRIAGPTQMVDPAKIKIKSRPIQNQDADFFAAELPREVWSVLQVQTARVGTHYTTEAVQIHGMWDDKPVFSSGIVLKQTRKYQIEHSCSTMESFSGSPVFDMATKAVVGIHLGHSPNRFAKMKPFILFSRRQETPWRMKDDDIYTQTDETASVQSDADSVYADSVESRADAWGVGRIDEERHQFAFESDDDDEYALSKYGEDARGRELFPDRYQEEAVDQSLQGKVPPPAIPVGTPIQLLNLKQFDGLEVVEVSSRLLQVGTVDAIRPMSAPPKEGPGDDLKLKFPQLKAFSWPPRSADAELSSLKYHVDFVPPRFTAEVMSELKMLVRGAVAQMKTEKLTIKYDVSDERFEQLLAGVVLDASPGYPYFKLGALNSDLLSNPTVKNYLKDIWKARMELLASRKLEPGELTPLEMLRQGWCDLVRVFIKNEPHSEAKMLAARYRLILSISFIDQMVERALYFEAHELEIRHWKDIPFAIGLSATDEDLKRFSEMIKAGFKGNDCQAFDWCQSEDWGELYCIFNSLLYEFDEKMQCIAHNREVTSNSQLMGLSDGKVMQPPRGIHKTGRYETGRRNCFVRLMVHLYATFKATRFVEMQKRSCEMGDDCLEKLWKQTPPKKGEVTVSVTEQYTATARQLGIRIKEWNSEFCGYEYDSETGGFRNTEASFWKTSYRLLSGTPTLAQIESVRFACRYHERLDCVIAEASSRLGKEGGSSC